MANLTLSHFIKKYIFLVTNCIHKNIIILCVLMCFVAHVIAQEEYRKDIPLKINRCSLAFNGESLEKGKSFDVYFIVENYRKHQSPKVEFQIFVPSQVNIIYGNGLRVIDPLSYRTTQSVFYKISVDYAYNKTEIPIGIWMSNDEGLPALCYQATIRIGQTESFAKVSPMRIDGYVNNGEKKVDAAIVERPTTNLFCVVVKSNLNVRKSPSARSKVIGTLSDGDSVEVYEVENQWAKIKYNGNQAFIASDNIVAIPARQEIVEVDTIVKESLMIPSIDTIVEEEKAYISTSDKGESCSAYSRSIMKEVLGFFGLSYSAGFEDASEGSYLMCSHVLGFKTRTGIGFSFSLGGNFKTNPSSTLILVGPNYSTQLSEKAFFFAPLYFAWTCITVNKEDYKSWGLMLSPSFGLKFGPIVVASGINFTWTEGSEKIVASFTLSLGFDIDVLDKFWL